MGLPVEIRLEVYDLAVQEARVVRERLQPHNCHFKLLWVCRQMHAEAKPLIYTYVSLLHERQIRAFIQTVPDSDAAYIVCADVANDGRVIRTTNAKEDAACVLTKVDIPISQLNIALHRMTALKHLRVFECKQGLPAHPARMSLILIAYHACLSTLPSAKYAKRIVVAFEHAMFPADHTPLLETYELFISSNSKAVALTKVGAKRLQRLRLSGSCSIAPDVDTAALREVALEGLTGNYFDRRDLNEWCRFSHLTTFVYTLEDRVGFELRDSHLLSLAYGPGHHLRKLILLGCSRLTSTVLAECLEQMGGLEYVALSITTVAEQRTNIVVALPSTLRVLKISVKNAWYAVPLLDEERAMCDVLESRLRAGDLRLKALAVHFRVSLMGDSRRTQWMELARKIGCQLQIGHWEGLASSGGDTAF